MPRSRRAGPASCTIPGAGFGNAVGQPTGNASVAGSTSTSTSMCSNPSAAANDRALHGHREASTRRRRRRAGTPRAVALLELHALRHHHADVLQVLAEDAGRSCRRPRRRSQPPSRHIHAICFGCWKIVYAKSVRPRICPLTCAAPLRREERDERRVERRVLLRRRLARRCARTAPRSCGSRPRATTAFTVMPYLPSSIAHTNVMPMIAALAAP